MREFFHDWRRKVGCGALVLACALAGMWVRSFRNNDEINIWSGHLQVDSLNSSPMGLCWMTKQHLPPNVPMLSGRFGWIAFQSFRNDVCDPFRWSTASEHNQWFGFNSATATINPPDRGDLTIRIIPYWSVVLLLTILSAYLLLCKPRPKVELDA